MVKIGNGLAIIAALAHRILVTIMCQQWWFYHQSGSAAAQSLDKSLVIQPITNLQLKFKIIEHMHIQTLSALFTALFNLLAIHAVACPGPFPNQNNQFVVLMNNHKFGSWLQKIEFAEGNTSNCNIQVNGGGPTLEIQDTSVKWQVQNDFASGESYVGTHQYTLTSTGTSGGDEDGDDDNGGGSAQFSFTIVICLLKEPSSATVTPAMYLKHDISEEQDFQVRLQKLAIEDGSPSAHCSFTLTYTVSGSFISMLNENYALTDEQNGVDLTAPQSAFTDKIRYTIEIKWECSFCTRIFEANIDVFVFDCRDYSISANAADQPVDQSITMDSWQGPQDVSWTAFSYEGTTDCGINEYETSCSSGESIDYCQDSNFIEINGGSRTLTFKTLHFLDKLIPTTAITFSISGYKKSAKPANPPVYTFIVTLVNPCLDATLEDNSVEQAFTNYSLANETVSKPVSSIKYYMKRENWYELVTPVNAVQTSCRVAYSFLDPATDAATSYDHISLVQAADFSLNLVMNYPSNVETAVERGMTQLKILATIVHASAGTFAWTIHATVEPNCSSHANPQVTHPDETQQQTIMLTTQPSYVYTWTAFALKDSQEDVFCTSDGITYAVESICETGPGCLQGDATLIAFDESSLNQDVTMTFTLPAKDAEVVVHGNGGILACNLGVAATTECSFKFAIQATSVKTGHMMGTVGVAEITLLTQCWNIPTDFSAQGWLQTSSEALEQLANGFQMRSDPQVVVLPAIVPTVFSPEPDRDVFHNCGDILYRLNNYSIGTLDVSSFTSPPSDLIRQEGPTLDIQTTDESLVQKQIDYRKYYDFRLTAEFLTSSTHVFMHPDTFTFSVKDLCREITYTEMPQVVISNAKSTLREWQQEETLISIAKPLRSFLTEIKVPLFEYFPYMETETSLLCGPLIYVNQTSVLDCFEDLNEAQVIEEDGISLTLEAAPDEMLGAEPTLQFQVRPFNFAGDDSQKQLIDFHVTVTPCQAFALDFGSNDFGTVQVNFNQRRLVPLEAFVAIPACGLTESYYVTMTQLDSWEAQLPATHADPIGTQPLSGLASVDDQRTRILINPQRQQSLMDLAFAVYVGATVGQGETAYYDHAPPFRLIILGEIYAPMNTAPLIEDFVSTIEVVALNATTVSVGRIVDIEEDPFYVDSVSVKYTDPTKQEEDTSWVKYLNSTSFDELFFFVNATEESVGYQLTIEITLADRDEIEPQKQAFVVSLKVLAPGEQRSSGNLTTGLEKPKQSVSVNLNLSQFGRLNVTVEEPTQEGLFKIYFSRPVNMLIQADEWTSQNEGAEMLRIAYLPSVETVEKFRGYEKPLTELSWQVKQIGWNDTEYGRALQGKTVLIDAIWVQMEFSDPLLVSNFETRDNIVIQLQNKLFEAELGEEAAAKVNVTAVDVKVELPSQIRPGQGELIGQIAAVSQVAIVTAFSFGLLLNIILAGLLQYLWGFVNTLQIIVMTVLFTVQQPVNSATVLISIMNLINFDVLHTELLVEQLITFQAEDEVLNEKFDVAGYGTSNFLLGLGNVLLVLTYFTVGLLVKLLLRCFTRRCSDNWLTRRVRKKVYLKIITLRFLLEGCVELGILSLLSIRHFQADDFATFWDCTSSVMAVVTLAGLITAPFYLAWNIRRLRFHKDTLSDEKKKYLEELFGAYKEGDPYAMAYGVIFFLRRYFMVVLLVFFPKKQYTQICCQLSSTLVVMMYIGYFEPYDLKLHNKQELANEVLAIYASYHLYVFTDWVGSKQRQWEAGWSLIGVILFCVLFNFAIILWQAVRKALLDLRRRKVRRRMREQMEKHLEQQVAQYLKSGAPERDTSVHLVELKQRHRAFPSHVLKNIKETASDPPNEQDSSIFVSSYCESLKKSIQQPSQQAPPIIDGEQQKQRVELANSQGERPTTASQNAQPKQSLLKPCTLPANASTSAPASRGYPRRNEEPARISEPSKVGQYSQTQVGNATPKNASSGFIYQQGRPIRLPRNSGTATLQKEDSDKEQQLSKEAVAASEGVATSEGMEPKRLKHSELEQLIAEMLREEDFKPRELAQATSAPVPPQMQPIGVSGSLARRFGLLDKVQEERPSKVGKNRKLQEEIDQLMAAIMADASDPKAAPSLLTSKGTGH